MANTSTGKKNNNKKRIHREIERVSIRSGRSADAVPHQNVLDLRSIVAKRELEHARAKRLKAQVQLQNIRHEEIVQKQSHTQIRGGVFARVSGLFARTPKTSTPSHAVSYPDMSVQSAHTQQKTQPLQKRTTHHTTSSTSHLPPVTLDSSLLTIAKEEFAADVDEEVIIPPPKPPKAPKKSHHLMRAKKRAAGEPRTRRVRFPSLKPTLAFAVLSLLFVLPASVSATLGQANTVKNSVTQSANEAFAHLYQAGLYFQNLQFADAKIECDNALEEFSKGKKEVSTINPFVTTLVQYVPGTGKQFSSGVALLGAGEELAQAGQQLSAGLSVLSSVDIGDVAQNQEGGLANILEVAHSSLSPASEHLKNASQLIQSVSADSVPEDKRQYVLLAQQALPEIESTVTNGVGLTETLLAFLGHEEAKRYLVLFQNNHEMRPTGGFIGSLALVAMNDGSVQNVEIPGGGVYDISGQFGKTIISPDPLHIVNPSWNLQDANWFPHFPASAQKIEWFLEESKAGTVDGVITVIPSVIEKLLAITGPIDLSQEYGVVITQENFYEEVQRRAEEKYDVTRESKKIIGDMTPLLLNQLFAQASTPDGLLKIVDVLRDSLAEKNILVYMNDPRLQSDFSSHDWTGELKSTDRDYLGIFHANIGGGKTDDAVEQIVKHNASIGNDGSIIDTVTLTRIHKGSDSDEFRSIKNLDYVRFYVPQGSTLITATGFESPSPELFLPDLDGAKVDQDLTQITGTVSENSTQHVFTNGEFEKTVFAGWMQTEAGESATVTLQYRLPFVVSISGFWDAIDHYSLLVQKQPGSFGDFFSSTVTLDDHVQIVRTFPTEYTGALQTVLTNDQFVGMVITKK